MRKLLFWQKICSTSYFCNAQSFNIFTILPPRGTRYVGAHLYPKRHSIRITHREGGRNAERAVNRQPGFRPGDSPSRNDAQNTRHTVTHMKWPLGQIRNFGKKMSHKNMFVKMTKSWTCRDIQIWHSSGCLSVCGRIHTCCIDFETHYDGMGKRFFWHLAFLKYFVKWSFSKKLVTHFWNIKS